MGDLGQISPSSTSPAAYLAMTAIGTELPTFTEHGPEQVG